MSVQLCTSYDEERCLLQPGPLQSVSVRSTKALQETTTTTTTTGASTMDLAGPQGQQLQSQAAAAPPTSPLLTSSTRARWNSPAQTGTRPPHTHQQLNQQHVHFQDLLCLGFESAATLKLPSPFSSKQGLD